MVAANTFLQATWCESLRSKSAMSGPASTSTVTSAPLGEHGSEPPSRLSGELPPATVHRADQVCDPLTRAEVGGRQPLSLCEQGDRVPDHA